VTALARGLEILRAFQPDKGPLGNSELSSITGIPKATISRLVYTLSELGYLTRDERLGKYELSPSILALGYPVLSNLKVRHIAHDYMQQLADLAGASVALASRSRLSMIYIDACNANTIKTLRLDVGTRVSMVHSSLGRAFLAGVSEAEREYFFGHFAQRLRDDWPTLKEQTETAIAQVRRRGFCLVDGDWQSDSRAVGVPLISTDGRTVLAMNCSGPAYALSIDRLENDLGPRLVHLCSSISPLLG
jgi:DNA-binding IclR family transcriptional regulator